MIHCVLNDDTHFDIKQIADISLRLMEAAQPLTTTDTKSIQEWGNQLSTLSEAPKLAVRLHLLSLLFEVRFKSKIFMKFYCGLAKKIPNMQLLPGR